jgi:Lon protease-like protein
MECRSDSTESPCHVPLFPLPNVVLLPRAVLPLHIFEERYKAMTADALAGPRLIAMALLRPGWEKDYYGRPALEPVVCIGRILSSEKLPDGKFNFLLQGHRRARIVREIHPELAYRTAEVVPLQETPTMEIDLMNDRQRLLGLFHQGPLAKTSIGRKFAEMLSGPMLTTDIADLIAFNFLDDATQKQSLLADVDPRHRLSQVVRAMEELGFSIEAATSAAVGDPSLN